MSYAIQLAHRCGATLHIYDLPHAERRLDWGMFGRMVGDLLPDALQNFIFDNTTHLEQKDGRFLAQLATAGVADLLILAGEHREWLALREGLLQQTISVAPCPVLSIPMERLHA